MGYYTKAQQAALYHSRRRRREALRGSGIYVDSLLGNDDNDGSLNSPLKTLSAVPLSDGVTINLMAGGLYREKIVTTDYENVTIQSVGDVVGQGMAKITGLEIYSGSWEDSTDRADANTNVYSITVTPSDFTIQSFAVHPIVVEDGEMLVMATSLANCQATAGTYWHGGVITAGDITLYVHPKGSTNPGSDGKEYEYTDRKDVVVLGDNSAADLLHTDGAGNQLGSLVHGFNCEISRVLATRNPIHDINGQSGIRRRCVAFHPVVMDSVGAMLIEWYSGTDVEGRTAENNECIAVGPATVGAIDVGGFGGHDAGSGSGWSVQRNTKCTTRNATIDANDTDAVVLDDCYIEGSGGILVDTPSGGSGPCPVEINNLKAVITARPSGGRNYFIASTNDEQIDINGARIHCDVSFGYMFNNPRAMSIQNSTLSVGAAMTGGLLNMNTFSYNSVIDFKYNIIEGSAGELLWDVRGSGPGFNTGDSVFDTDYNCISPLTGNGGTGIAYRGPNGSGGQTTAYRLVDVQAWIGYELNSIDDDPQLADPANGDFTVGGDLSAIPTIGPDLSVEYSPIPETEAAAAYWIINGQLPA